MHDDMLLSISFTTTPHSYVVSAHFFTFHAGILFNSCPLGNICILNARLRGELISKASSCIRPITCTVLASAEKTGFFFKTLSFNDQYKSQVWLQKRQVNAETGSDWPEAIMLKGFCFGIQR